jgi:hypothetical protein
MDHVTTQTSCRREVKGRYGSCATPLGGGGVLGVCTCGGRIGGEVEGDHRLLGAPLLLLWGYPASGLSSSTPTPLLLQSTTRLIDHNHN